MVLSGLITSLMKSYLSPFIDEFNADQLSLFGWSGEVTLSNVNLKPNAFDRLKIPFRICHGFVGKINASVPWLNIYTDPIVIEISDIFAVVVPNTQIQFNEEDEKRYEWESKKDLLANIELMKQKLEEEKDGPASSDDGFFIKLAAVAVKNIQIFIKNVHICYEDDVTCKKPFQMGLTLSQLVFETEANQLVSNHNDNIIKKLIKLEGFSLYLNHHRPTHLFKQSGAFINKYLMKIFQEKDYKDTNLEFVLIPNNFFANARIHRKPEADQYQYPIVDLRMNLDSFNVQLTKKQVHLILLLLDSVDRMKAAQPFRKWRPTVDITKHPREWWLFMYTAITETGVRRRKREFSWKNIESVCLMRREYTRLYKQKLLGESVDLEDLEKELSLISITMARCKAEFETKKILEERQSKQSNRGWFGGWWGRSRNDDVTEENWFMQNLNKEFTPDEKQKLYKAIGYEENTLEHVYPPDFTGYILQLKINQFKVSFKKGDHTQLAALEFNNCWFEFQMRPSSVNILIRNKFDALNVVGLNEIFIIKNQVDKDFLSFEFEMNPLDKNCDFSILLNMKSLYLLYDITTVNELYTLFTINENICLDEIQLYASYKITDFKNMTYTGLKYAVDKHKRFKLNIKADPSFVVVPKKANIAESNSIALLSLGEFQMYSTVVPKQVVSDSSILRHDQNEDIKQMVYEKYTLNISKFQLMLSDRQNWKKDLEELNTDRHVLYPFDFNLEIKRSIIPKNIHFPKLILTGEIPSIELRASDTQISQLMIIISTLPYGPVTDPGLSSLSQISKSSAVLSKPNLNNEINDAVKLAADAVKEPEKPRKRDEVDRENKNSLPTVSKSAQASESTTIYRDTVFDFNLDQISLTVYKNDRSSTSTLVLMQLDKFSLHGEILTDSTIWLNCSVLDIRLEDIRPSRKNATIHTMLKSLNQDSQSPLLSFYMTKKKSEIVIFLNMSGFSMILALDYLLAVIFATVNSFSMAEVNTESAMRSSDSKLAHQHSITGPKDGHKQPQQQQQRDMIVSIEMDFTKIEVIMMESLDYTNSDACVFACSSKVSVVVSDVVIVSGSLSDITMTLNNYIRYTESQEIGAHILAPTHLTLNGSIKGKIQHLDFNFSDIYISVTPHMISVVVRIISAIGVSTDTAPIDSEISQIEELSRPRPVDSKAWFLTTAPVAIEATEELQSEPVAEQSQYIFHLNKIKVLIKSRSESTNPLIKMSLSVVAKMINNKNLDFDASVSAGYYNPMLMVWEPLIETVDNQFWIVQGELNIGESAVKCKVESSRLEILLTNTSINILYETINACFEMLTYGGVTPVHKKNRVLVSNQLGYDLNLILAKSNIVPIDTDNVPYNAKKISEQNNFLIHSGQSFMFQTSDLSKVELMLNLILSSSCIIDRTIICTKSSLRCYFTNVKTYPVNETWKWLVQVSYNAAMSSKEITFRSNTHIVNYFDNPFNLYSYDERKTTFVCTINPNETYFLPLNLVYGEEMLYIRPSCDFELSENPLNWRSINLHPHETDSYVLSLCSPSRDLLSRDYLTLYCRNKTTPAQRFAIKVRGEQTPVMFEETGILSSDDSYIYMIKLVPFARIKNLLPYSVEFFYNSMSAPQLLAAGEDFNLTFMTFGKTVIEYKLLDYLGQNWTTKCLLPVCGKENETRYLTFISEANRHSLILALNYSVENSSLILSLHSSFWMINKTNENISYKIDRHHIYLHEHNVDRPFLLTFDPNKAHRKTKMCLSINDSEYSDFFPLNVVPFRTTLLPISKTLKYSYSVLVEVELAGIGISKIITLNSFYTIYNLSKFSVDCSENFEDWFKIESEHMLPMFPKNSAKQSLCFRFSDTDFSSKSISIRESSQTLLQISNRYLFVEMDISEFGGEIRIRDYFDGAAPAKIINLLNRDIYYGQKNVTDWDKNRHVKKLRPRQTAFFCWIDPSSTRELVYKISMYEPENTINIDFDKCLTDQERYGLVSFLDGIQRTLIFTHDQQLPSYLLRTEEFVTPTFTMELTLKGLGLNIVHNDRYQDLMYLSIDSSHLWECKPDKGKNFKAVSIKENNYLEHMYQAYLLQLKSFSAGIDGVCSQGAFQVNFEQMMMFKPRVAELRRASNRGLWVQFSKSEHIKQIHLKVNRIQIDNQLQDRAFDVVLIPVTLPKSVYDKFEIEQKSFIELSAIIQSSSSVTRYKYIQLLVQEFVLKVDIGWICLLMEAFDLESPQQEKAKVLIEKDLNTIYQNNTISKLQGSVMRKTYYDFFLLGPLKLHLSFAIGELPNGKFSAAIDFIIRLTGQTIGEINDTLFKLDYFERKLVFMGDSELTYQIIEHYKTQLISQFYKLILGLDIIGNPMKLALGIKKGVGDFFYEPAVGIIHGPEEFAEGLATGFKSLATNVIGGTAEALGRIGTRIGTGVGTLTFDEKFQRERRERMNRKVSFAESGRSLLRGFVSGVTGVFTKPIEGAKEEGVEGLFKGVGVGVVGIFAQPATGLIDFASGSLNAFNNVLDPKKLSKTIRPPRPFKIGHEIRPYNLREAIGSQILANLNEVQEEENSYESHFELESGNMLILTKNRLYFLKQSLISSNWEVDWSELWNNCSKVQRVDQTKIRLEVKEGKKTLLLFGNVNEHTIICNNDQQSQTLFQLIKKHLPNYGL